ncbi:MAG: NAD-dependent deacylase [Bacteroidales bacterium]|nr:NAD-dependent deacylase [Bacteroidales bacterium]
MAKFEKEINSAAELILASKYLVAFTGAGISVESGIPPFRGAEGLWSKYNPEVLDLHYFHRNPKDSWRVIKEIFYDFFGNAQPNSGHLSLSKLEEIGKLKCVITQNIDNLHQLAGNTVIHEFHGNSQKMICTNCSKHFTVTEVDLSVLPPLCDECHGLLKPDFIFFGESIPMDAYHASVRAAENADVFFIIGSTGEVMPASQIPVMAKQHGAKIIEINPEPSKYTHGLTDIYLQGKAGDILTQIVNNIILNHQT